MRERLKREERKLRGRKDLGSMESLTIIGPFAGRGPSLGCLCRAWNPSLMIVQAAEANGSYRGEGAI